MALRTGAGGVTGEAEFRPGRVREMIQHTVDRKQVHGQCTFIYFPAAASGSGVVEPKRVGQTVVWY